MNDFSLIMALIFLSPFAFLGMFKVFSFVWDKIKVRRGYILCVKKLANDRLIGFWKKPSGNKISIGGKEITIKMGKDWAYFDGTIPTVFLDENDQQIELTVEGGKIPSDEYKDMYDIAYLSGRVAVMQENKRMFLFLMIAAIAAVGAIGVVMWLTIQMQDVIGAMPRIMESLETIITRLPG